MKLEIGRHSVTTRLRARGPGEPFGKIDESGQIERLDQHLGRAVFVRPGFDRRILAMQHHDDRQRRPARLQGAPGGGGQRPGIVVDQRQGEISKYSRAELLGQDHRILNSQLHPKEFIRDLWRTIAQGRVWRGELRNRAKDGSLYWVDTTIVPFLDASGKPWQYMAIRYDITQRKEQEERLREQSALARLGEMSAVVAHEVRNPLAGIRGALQVISTRFPAGATERRVMGDIVARIDSLSGTLDDLLMFARPHEPKMAPLAVGPFLADVGTWLKQDKSMGEVQVEFDADDALIVVDSEQLRLVFTNLLLNAAQAMECRGRIQLSARADDHGCALVVQDSGPGMPEEVRARVFEPFYTTKARGTGLGLPTVKRIIEAHHGTIAVECPPSGGTRVRLTLPASKAPAVPPSHTR